MSVTSNLLSEIDDTDSVIPTTVFPLKFGAITSYDLDVTCY